MTYHVHSVEQDMAGKWYARVVITPDEATFLKFDEFPSMEQIQAAAAEAAPRLIRARDEQGRFVGDDPTTPAVNEARTDATAE